MKLFYDEALSEFSPISEYLTILNQNIQKIMSNIVNIKLNDF